MSPSVDASHDLRSAQVQCYTEENWAEYFRLADRLALVSPGYAACYERWLQTVLHEVSRGVTDLRFLQIGAMDGKRHDPIYPFVKHYRWRGVILEPLPDLHEALAQNYDGHEHVTLIRAALLDRDGGREMLRVRRDAIASGAVPEWAEGLGSFHPERNALGGVGVAPLLHEAILAHSEWQSVEGVTVATVAARCGLDHLDVLQIDAEGCELDILTQVDRHGFAPRVIHLEHWALPPADRRALFGLLGERGYTLRMSESDVLAISGRLRAEIEQRGGWAP